MLRKIIFLLLGLTLGLSLQTRAQAQAQDKDALWIHGYNGDVTTWRDFSLNISGYNALITGYKGYHLKPLMPETYDTESGVNSFISQIIYRNPGVFQNNMITVAHSFGGVAARHMDRTDATHKLGGIITVGSPLNGAGIASSINDGSVAAFGKNALHSLEVGPLSQFLPMNIASGLLGIINFFGDNIITKKGAPNQSTWEMALGSNFITADMNASPTPTPKVSIYGNEVSPVHWNFIASTTGRNNVVAIAQGAEDDYYTLFVVNTVAGTVHGILGFWNPAFWEDAILEFWRAIMWRIGYDWLHDSERMWNVLIGSNIPAPVQCNTYTGFVCSYSNNANFMNPSCWQTVTSCYGPQMLGKSDGFIPCSSQMGLGSNSWAGVPKVEAFNVNHSNEHDKDNVKMQEKFDEVFAGIYGDYFITAKR